MAEYVRKKVHQDKKLKSHVFLLLLILGVSAQTHAQAPAQGKRLRIVLDPGHGGRDSATKAHGFFEKDVVLNIAFEIQRHLEESNYEVILTRNADYFVPLTERAKVKGDVFISLHANSVPDSIGPSVRSMIKGMEIYVDERMGGASRLLKSKDLSKHLHQQLSAIDGMTVRGKVRHRPLAVLKDNLSPAVLLELGYLTNFEDLGFLTTASCYTAIAKAIGKALSGYSQKWAD